MDNETQMFLLRLLSGKPPVAPGKTQLSSWKKATHIYKKFSTNTMIVISKPMTDPFMCCYIWCSMDPINIPPLCLFAYIQAHHGSVMGNAWHGTHAPISGHRNLVTVDIYRKPMVLRKLPFFHVLFSIQDIMSLYIYNILTCWKTPPFFVDLYTHTHQLGFSGRWGWILLQRCCQCPALVSILESRGEPLVKWSTWSCSHMFFVQDGAPPVISWFKNHSNYRYIYHRP